MATHSSSLAWRIPMDRGAYMVASYSPWGHKELDMTEQLSTAQHMYTHIYIYTIHIHMCVYIFIYIHIYFHSYWSSMPFYRGSSKPRD